MVLNYDLNATIVAQVNPFLTNFSYKIFQGTLTPNFVSMSYQCQHHHLNKERYTLVS